MAKTRKKREVVEQETYNMLDVIAELWHPSEREYMKTLMANKLAEHYGEKWQDKTKCRNCGASMCKITYSLNPTAARALMAYAAAVEERMMSGKGYTFTEANKIKIAHLRDVTFTGKAQMTILRYHGLIAKHRVNGVHKDSQWVITRWGWSFLRGMPKARSVTVWRGEIVERSEDFVTITDVLGNDAMMWNGERYTFAAPHEGELI